LYSSTEYIKTFAGLAVFNKPTKGATTAFGAICGEKLEE
jgi:hypothetical protein